MWVSGAKLALMFTSLRERWSHVCMQTWMCSVGYDCLFGVAQCWLLFMKLYWLRVCLIFAVEEVDSNLVFVAIKIFMMLCNIHSFTITNNTCHACIPRLRSKLFSFNFVLRAAQYAENQQQTIVVIWVVKCNCNFYLVKYMIEVRPKVDQDKCFWCVCSVIYYWMVGVVARCIWVLSSYHGTCSLS